MTVGLALAGVCALATNVAFLLKHKGAVAAPRVVFRHPLRALADLFSSRWWTIGWLVALLAWGFHVAALALAPLSVVQAVISGGLVFLALIAERFFGLKLRRRDWLGLLLTSIGLAFLFITAGHAAETDQYSLAALIAFECGLIALAALVILASIRVERLRHRRGLILGAAAGGLFGVSDIAIKYLADPVLDDVLALVSPWTASALVASIVAFYASARALQVGPGVVVITVTVAAANLAAIAGGILVFQEPIGDGALAIVGRVLAFLLVIGGAALMPGPVRAGEAVSIREHEKEEARRRQERERAEQRRRRPEPSAA